MHIFPILEIYRNIIARRSVDKDGGNGHLAEMDKLTTLLKKKKYMLYACVNLEVTF